MAGNIRDHRLERVPLGTDNCFGRACQHALGDDEFADEVDQMIDLLDPDADRRSCGRCLRWARHRLGRHTRTLRSTHRRRIRRGLRRSGLVIEETEGLRSVGNGCDDTFIAGCADEREEIVQLVVGARRAQFDPPGIRLARIENLENPQRLESSSQRFDDARATRRIGDRDRNAPALFGGRRSDGRRRPA